jgi:hypothetical protein
VPSAPLASSSAPSSLSLLPSASASPTPSQSQSQSRSQSRWPTRIAILCFLLFASSFLYFFVDDEAIPFVYAQNVLHHKGLTYSAFEGHVEGYSDFLHIWLATALLTLTRAVGAPKLSVFFIAKAISLAAGVLIIVLTDRILRASPAIDRHGRFVGLMFLALGGPLAVWSCSSLETVTFAAMVTVLLCALSAMLVEGPPLWAARVACAAAILAILERIDGFIHVSVLIAAAFIIAPAARRRTLLQRVILPASVVFVSYHLARRWYFGEWLPVPLVAKVLYKLHLTGVVVKKPPEQNYVVGFLASAGWLAPLGAPAAVIWLRRERRLLALIVATLVMCVYVGLVGDWMFGYRLFVPLLPWFAILIAAAVSALIQRWPVRRPWIVAAIVIVSFAVTAYRFEQTYQRDEERRDWLLHPSARAADYFFPMYSLYEVTRPYVSPAAGATMAFNQAGFLPFMFDAENVDDLGICTRFIAYLPTADDVHTEVGRYAALTNKPSIRAAHAYLLYREPRLLITRGDLVRHANANHAPEFLLDYRYRAVAYDAAGDNVVYIRTDVPVEPFRQEPRRFLENLVHVSSLRHAMLREAVVPPKAYLREFPYLYDGTGHITFRDGDALDLTFGPPESDAYEIHFDELAASAPVTFLLQLRSSDGRVTYRQEIQVTPDTPAHSHLLLPDAIPAARFTLQAITHNSDPVTVRLTDLRIQGQRRALAAYIQQTLHFPASTLTRKQ